MKTLFLALVLLCSCGKSNVSNKTEIQADKKPDMIKKPTCVYRIVNNEIVKYIFSIDVFTSDTSAIKNIFKTKPVITILKEKGTYDDNEYTSYVYETRNTHVKLFKNDEGFYIEEAFIKDDEIKLYNNCSIGMLKEDFIKQMSIENTKCDSIVIIDEDQSLILNFTFNNGRLKELSIKASE